MIKDSVYSTIVDLDTAKKLKKLGFREKVPHAYMHDPIYAINDKRESVISNADNYSLMLFPLSKIYNESNTFYEILRFQVENERVLILEEARIEADVYFDFNQDMRRLSVEYSSGSEYMDDEKCLNMHIDSFTFDASNFDQLEILRNLPNYNDGDFEFTIITDTISAPTIEHMNYWLKERNIELN